MKQKITVGLILTAILMLCCLATDAPVGLYVVSVPMGMGLGQILLIGANSGNGGDSGII